MQPSVIEATIEARLAGQHIPVLPPGAPRLLKNLSDENIDYKTLTNTIELFPSIVGRLIALANSPWSAPAEEITSLPRACSRLGFAVVKSTSIAMAIASPFDSNRCQEFKAQYYWYRAFMTAEAASQLFKILPDTLKHDVDTLRTVGLIHNLGILLLADRLPETMGKAIKEKQAGKADSVREALFSALGFDDTHAGQYLAKRWSLPPLFQKVLGHYPELQYSGIYWEEVNATGVASSIVSDIQSEQQRTLTDPRLEKLGINTDQILDIYQLFQEQQEKIEELVVEIFGH